MLTKQAIIYERGPIDRWGFRAEGEENLEDYRIRRPCVLYVFTIPPLEGDVERRQKKYWTTRKPGGPLRNPRSWLKTPLSEADKKAVASGYHVHGGFSGGWSAAWRTERKMRDLDARLNLYQWGSHKEIRNVRQMLETTTKNAHTAWMEERWHSGPVCKQQPPRHKTERRYLYPAPGPSAPNPYRKPFPNGPRTKDPRASSLGLPTEYVCFTDGVKHGVEVPRGQGLAVYSNCVLPSGCPNVGVVEARDDG